MEHREHHQKKTVNVIGGFLGAGKTTLLNWILKDWKEGRVDVLVREYGVVSIDHELIGHVRPEHIHIFPGLSLHEDPQLVLYDYMHRLFQETEKDPFDYLLLETSGLDNPESMVQLFLLGHMATHYRLGSYIVVVDAEYGMLNLDEYSIAMSQVAYADAILINKIDMATPADIDRLEQRLRRINAVADIQRVTYAEADLAKIMNIGLYDQLKNLKQTEGGGEAMDGIETITLVQDRPMDKQKINAWISHLFENHGQDILRGKGFFCFQGEDYRYEFQSVRKSFHSKADRLWQEGDERKSVVVLIGKAGLSQLGLQATFDKCVAQA